MKYFRLALAIVLVVGILFLLGRGNLLLWQVSFTGMWLARFVCCALFSLLILGWLFDIARSVVLATKDPWSSRSQQRERMMISKEDDLVAGFIVLLILSGMLLMWWQCDRSSLSQPLLTVYQQYFLLSVGLSFGLLVLSCIHVNSYYRKANRLIAQQRVIREESYRRPTGEFGSGSFEPERSGYPPGGYRPPLYVSDLGPDGRPVSPSAQ